MDGLGKIREGLEKATEEMEEISAKNESLEVELQETKRCIAEVLETLCSGTPMGEPLVPELEKLIRLLRESESNFTDRAKVLQKMV